MTRYFHGPKLVFLYISTYVTEDWDKYVEEIEGVHLTVSTFSVRYVRANNVGVSLKYGYLTWNSYQHGRFQNHSLKQVKSRITK